VSGADDRVVVIGGGLAGITAALRLAEAGLQVTVLEARPWLGGATWSFGRRGLTIDNGQHVFLRCFTAYRDLLARLGVGDSAPVQERLDLTVLAPEGPVRLRRTAWPAPTHLATVLARYRPLTVAQRFSVLPAAMTMWLADLTGPDPEPASIAQWLSRHRQDDRMISRFWELFLVPFMNATATTTDQGTAAAFISAALLSRRDQADLGVATVPLRDLHAAPASQRLGQLGVQVRLGAHVAGVRREAHGGFVVRLEDDATPPGEVPGQLALGDDAEREIPAAGVVLAVPAWAAGGLAPPELAADAAGWGQLGPAPVVSIHVLYDARVTGLPFAMPVCSPLRWIADKTVAAGLHTGQYLAASVPAAGKIVDESPAALRARMLPELARLFPAAAGAKVEDFFVTRERSATFLPAPGTRMMRPGQLTRLRGLALAGAWTDTGWPDTMEGAVRSGRLAADAILSTLGEAGPAAGSSSGSAGEPAGAVARAAIARPAEPAPAPAQAMPGPGPAAPAGPDPIVAADAVAADAVAVGAVARPVGSETGGSGTGGSGTGPSDAAAADLPGAAVREAVVPRQGGPGPESPDASAAPAVRKLAAVPGAPDRRAARQGRKQAGRRPDATEHSESAAGP
jgi:squalene-associated FAD-dependent desaturase